MDINKKIYHDKNLNLEGNTITREAVRGIIIKNKKILMIFSSKNGDYKFPGGGIEAEETPEEALKREIKEECGALVTKIKENIGKIIEFKKAVEKDYDVFKMTSYYYICEIEENKFDLCLDQYEKELGFNPEWINFDLAIQKNKAILNSASKKAPRWTKRDTYVMEQIKK